MKLLLAGGGTMGPVSPLIAVYQKLKTTQTIDCLFLGTAQGPERTAVESYGIRFRSIRAGKLRRYINWQNLSDPFNVIIGFFQSLGIMVRWRPDVVVVAGGFVGVPVVWAAWLLRVPVLIHQQDILTGLANRLMCRFARRITVSFETSLADFNPKKVVHTGNPVRPEIGQCHTDARSMFHLTADRPVILILGGGTGAANINRLVAESLSELTKYCQVLHITGRGKQTNLEHEGYRQYEFLTSEMSDALCAADIVVCRSGLSTLSELIVLSKPVITIPMADTHQEDNASYFQSRHALVGMREHGLTAASFAGAIKELLFNQTRREQLAQTLSGLMPHDGAARVAAEVMKLIAKPTNQKMPTQTKSKTSNDRA